MAKTGLLVVTNPTKVNRILPVVKGHVQKTLYVQFSPGHRLVPPWTIIGEPIINPPLYSKTVIGIYSQTSAACQNLDVRVLLTGIKDPFLSSINTRKEIEVVFFDQNYSNDEKNHFVQSCLSNTTSTCQIVTLGGNIDNSTTRSDVDSYLLSKINVKSSENTSKNEHKMYKNVVLGGTFDRLHIGHKILLSEAILRCSKKLTVGVTDTPMLKSKKVWELIEPCTQRISHMQDFLQDVDPSLQYEIVPIVDPFGPTKEDPNLQMLVVSTETRRGGLKVNEVRAQNGLPLLDMFCVDLLEGSVQNNMEEIKISSSNHRMRLLGTRLHSPEPKSHLPAHPYVIGLTGTIASGKSSVGKHLSQLGAGLIDCDALAHGLYHKGQIYHQRLTEQFGDGILDSQGEINRKALGAIVFNDKTQLDKLNSLLWPAILEKACEEGLRLHREGAQVVVMDAAVLIQAGWDKHCHEVWTCVVPPEEAIKRIQARNGLSVSEAEARLSSQPSNADLINKANLVFYTLWEPQYTQSQVEKAWKELQTFLGNQAKL